ncbi:MAG: cysteine synthase family protein [Bacteroidota bacterium]
MILSTKVSPPAVVDNVLESIGNTPMVRIRRSLGGVKAEVLGKVEGFNPGHSAKDRVALYMVEKAEREGKIKPGATIIEATSGNTGFSLAMVSLLKGYKCVLTVSSKASDEKLRLLQSMGAEVFICPSSAKPEDPNSYYSVAKQLHQEIPNSYYLNQNFDAANKEAHYTTTGPEIWEQTQGRITHYVCCVGTGGTISGTAKYLKEQNPNIQVIGVDAYGSVLKRYWETGIFDEKEIYSYKVEGLGKTIIPGNVDFDLIDRMIKVHDKDSAVRARQLAQRDGLFVGYSAGAAMQAVHKLKRELTKDDVVVVLFSDHGSRYLGKIYSDDWMEDVGFLKEKKEPSYNSYLYRKYKIQYKRIYNKVNYYINQTLKM